MTISKLSGRFITGGVETCCLFVDPFFKLDGIIKRLIDIWLSTLIFNKNILFYYLMYLYTINSRDDRGPLLKEGILKVV